MRSDAQFYSKIICYGSDVCALATSYPKMYDGKLYIDNLKCGDIYLSSFQFHFFATTSFLIYAFSANLNCGVCRRILFLFAKKSRCNFMNLLFADVADI